MKYNKDLTGQVFGRLTVVGFSYMGRNSQSIWKCKCLCGNMVDVRGSSLSAGVTKSCSCLQKDIVSELSISRGIDLRGQRFGRLLVERPSTVRTKCKHIRWFCICDCGNTTDTTSNNLRAGNTLSCGCLGLENRKKSRTTHGQTKNGKVSAEYTAWLSMKNRCYYDRYINFDKYGGRGIVVCERWLNSFENFYDDMNTRPSKRHSLDRIDVNGNYCKENCRWATPKQQARNTTKNRWIEYNGKRMILQDWAIFFDVTGNTISRHLKRGQTFEHIYNFYKNKNNL